MGATETPSRSRAADGFRLLFGWAAAAVHRPLPEPVRRRAALILADDLGAMVAAAGEPQVAAVREGLAGNSHGPQATVFAPGAAKLDRFAAAAANGMAATWCELDEGFRAAPCHAGAYLLPALLAEAEHRGAATDAVLTALAVAYEVTARLALAFPFATMNVHPHAAFATIGAAAGAGLMRGLAADLLLDAVSGAASMSFAGPFGHATEGALVRNGWTSAGAWIGLQAADWSVAGIGGLAETPYDVFVTVFHTGCKPEELTAGLGENWAVAGGYHKIFACCQYAHSVVEATLDLHARLKASGRGVGDLAEIRVETHPRGLNLTTVEPATVLAAKFSMPHAVAAVATLGTGGQAAFSAATLTDAPIAALRRKVRLAAHPAIGDWPLDRPARVSWRFADGESWFAECASARGGSDQPFDEATMLAKLAENTRASFPAMADVLAGLLAGDRPGRPWRDTVAAKTARGELP
jgi:2-methylcitrate dehydratase PrpD